MFGSSPADQLGPKVPLLPHCSGLPRCSGLPHSSGITHCSGIPHRTVVAWRKYTNIKNNAIVVARVRPTHSARGVRFPRSGSMYRCDMGGAAPRTTAAPTDSIQQRARKPADIP